MIEMNVEKEVRTQNKIFKGLTARNLIGVGIGLALGFFLSIILHFIALDQTTSILCYLIAGGGSAYAIGWYNSNGLYIEDVVKKKINTFVYNNKHRRYRTLNHFITMYNKSYQKMRAKDMNDKAKAKSIKTHQKSVHDKKMKARIKGFA